MADDTTEIEMQDEVAKGEEEMMYGQGELFRYMLQLRFC
jgi:hypothetical protein